MKTPEQIRDMEFQKSPMGGYKQSDVELFLEEIASQIEILMKQKADSDRKLQELSKRSPEAALSTAGIQNVLISAQKVADDITAGAKAEAEKIIAEAGLKKTEAGIKAAEIISEAERKAVLLGETAEDEAAKIVAAAVKKSEETVAAAKDSVDLEQKLYDRLKIEIADFKKKAVEQCGSVIELLNQLPSEIPFNLERAKTVLSVDFSNPAELLDKAVEERLKKKAEEAAAAEQAEKEAAEKAAAEKAAVEKAAAEKAAAEKAAAARKPEPEAAEEKAEAPKVTATVLTGAAEKAEEVKEKSLRFTFDEDDEADEDDKAPAAAKEEKHSKGHIQFDDDDDEPLLFFHKKKK